MTDSKYCRAYSSITVQSIRCYVRGYIYCKMIAADIIPDDVAEKTVRDMIGRACTDVLYEIRNKPDVETVQSLIRENESMIHTDEEMIDLAVMRLALTNRMYMEYLSSMNTDKGNSTDRNTVMENGTEV